MADNEKEVVEGPTARGVDWEVVTLTESTYAAAPGPGGTAGKPTTESTDLDAGKGERGSSNALLMSDHFVFPPSEHENLPIETNFYEIQPEKDVHEATTSVEDNSFKNVGGKYDVGSETIQFYDEGKNLSVDDVETRGAVADYGSFHAEDDGHGFVHDDGNDGGDDSHDKLDLPSESAGRKSYDSGAPCKCWWKKHMSCLYHQAKETNALWSVVVAAALVGLVILGRWHKDKLHLNQFKWHSCSAVRG